MNDVLSANTAMPENAVTRWFGPHFSNLHPLLQALHRHGGTLHGIVHIDCGKGIGRWIGRRLARKLGMPTDAAQSDFVVEIRHEATHLHWHRRFGTGQEMVSIFAPVGIWPSGYWTEDTGALQLRLTIDVVDGGWYWRPLGIRFTGIPLPLWLFPRAHAYKTVEDGRYRFAVEFTLPVIGRILSYQGLLDADVEGAHPK